jgi:tetratricopeptide (TPR) repeat protein
MGQSVLQLLDREDQLAAMTAALRRTAAGQGTVVVLDGAAGTGKSALVARARELARTAGLQLLSACGGELERDYPFGVVRQLYEPVLASAGPERRDRLLAGAAAPAAWVLGLSEGESGVHAAGFAAMRAIYWLTARLASDGAALIAVDDAHWADASSLRALEYLARRIGALPVTLIVAFRPQEPGASVELLDQLRGTPDAVRLSLGPLRPGSVASIVRDRIPSAGDEICEACHAATVGNPLYLEELLRTLRSNGSPPTAEQALQASVPSLGERVLRRAARVADDAPALARSMAVLGDGARLAAAAALASMSEQSAGPIAFGLRRIEVLASEDPFAFVHPLIRRSVYDSMPDSERQSVHRQAAHLLEQGSAPPEVVAAHLRMLTPAGATAVASTLLAAAEQALEQAAPDEAVGWLERALAEDAPDPPRVQLLARLGLAKLLQRDPAAIAHLREAYELAEEPHLRGQMAGTLVEFLAQAGQWDDAIALIESAERELSGADAELRVEVAALRAAVTLFDPARGQDFDERRATYVELAGRDFWASQAIAALLAIHASHRGMTREAREFAERALIGGRLLSERGAGAWTPPQYLGALIEVEDFDRALSAIDELDVAARASGSALAEFTAMTFRGWTHARLGDLATAGADATSVFGFMQDSGLLMGITTASFFLLDVLLERDDVAEITDLVEQTELGPDFMSTVSGAMLLEARGSLRLQRRDSERGIEDLRAAGRINTALRFGPTYSSWRSTLALALPGSAREEARKLARAELELAETSGLTRPRGIALRTVGLLEDGHAGVARLRQSVELLEGSPSRLEHARADATR